jgi:hypothetical protein
MKNKTFISYFDILGYKNYVTSHSSEDVHDLLLNRILVLFESAVPHTENIPIGPNTVVPDLKDSRISLLNISDTFIAWTKDDSVDSLNDILSFTQSFNQNMNRHGLPVRGVLVYDEFEMIRGHHRLESGVTFGVNAMHGIGLINAHEKTEAQKWAGAYVDESVERFLTSKGMNVHNTLNPFAKKYFVPLKSGSTLEAYVFRLAYPGISSLGLEQIKDEITGMFHRPGVLVGNVQIKLDNTLGFVASCSTPN